MFMTQKIIIHSISTQDVSYVDAECDWDTPHYIYLQGGEKGLVITPKGSDNYYTAFVEALVDRVLYRGEGSTIQEAEKAAWVKWVEASECKHDFEPKGYKNGGGICVKCKMFNANAFTGSQLGQFCEVCNVGTLNLCIENKWYCAEHVPFKEEREEYFAIPGDVFYKLTDEEKATIIQRRKEIKKIVGPSLWG